MVKRIAGVVFATAIVMLAYVPRAAAHGEAGDKSFIKILTVGWYDVHISPTHIKVGEPVTIEGTARILNTWPYTLDPPVTSYMVPVVPGPVFALTERIINGKYAPHEITSQRDGLYHFKMVMLGRVPGHWHVHPGFAFYGTGTLIGPGQWVDVDPSDKPFVYPVTLLTGKTINIETYGASRVWWWSFIAFVLGFIWMWFWTVPRRTVTNPQVTLAVPWTDTGPDLGMITDSDHKFCSTMAALSIGLIVVGWIMMASRYPVRLPQQTIRFDPTVMAPAPTMVQAEATAATWDEKTDTMQVKVSVKNIGQTPVTLKQFIYGLVTFVNGGEEEQNAAGPHDPELSFVGRLHVDPDGPIGPGETKDLTLSMSGSVFDTERLIPIGDPQQQIAGMLRFQDDKGHEDMVIISTSIASTSYAAQYIP